MTSPDRSPETRYVPGPRGLIAYQVIGDGPIDIGYVSGSTSNVDVRWEFARFSSFFTRLASFSRLILFDRSGTGASDPIPLDHLPTWEEWADELRIVLDAAGSRNTALFTVLDAGAMGMLFAASHPGRTRALVLGNTTARPIRADDYPIGLERNMLETAIAHLETTWGTEEGASSLSPSLAGDPQARAWFAKYMRASASPRVAATYLRENIDLDLRSILGQIHVPTLVLNSDFPLIPAEQGRYIAAHIPDARFVHVPGRDSTFVFEEADLVLDTIEEFLTGSAPVRESQRFLATVMFTDIVSSTQKGLELGDARWRDTLARHYEASAREIERHQGRLVKTTGDGLLATFTGPTRAVGCAYAIRDLAEAQDLQLRVGLHAGEVESANEDLSGVALHVAARITSQAGAGQILVSRIVTDLVAGSGLSFRDMGEYELRGLPGHWQLLEAYPRG